MYSKATNCPLVLEVFVEFITSIFSTTVAVEAFDFNIVLGTHPGLKFSVASEGLVFCLNKVNFRKSAASICEADEIFLLVDHFH